MKTPGWSPWPQLKKHVVVCVPENNSEQIVVLTNRALLEEVLKCWYN